MPTKPPTFRQHMPSVSPRALYDATRRKDDPALAQAARIRNGSTWRKVRAQHIAQHPLCVDPFKAHGEWPEPACDVHHIIGLTADDSLAYTPENLASLCKSCHNRVEALERAGKGTQGLFVL